jgi:hypothetical protein
MRPPINELVRVADPDISKSALAERRQSAAIECSSAWNLLQTTKIDRDRTHWAA